MLGRNFVSGGKQISQELDSDHGSNPLVWTRPRGRLESKEYSLPWTRLGSP